MEKEAGLKKFKPHQVYNVDEKDITTVTGIWPVNRNIFRDWQFKTAATTEISVAPARELLEEQEMNTSTDIGLNIPLISSNSNSGNSVSLVKLFTNSRDQQILILFQLLAATNELK